MERDYNNTWMPNNYSEDALMGILPADFGF